MDFRRFFWVQLFFLVFLVSNFTVVFGATPPPTESPFGHGFSSFYSKNDLFQADYPIQFNSSNNAILFFYNGYRSAGTMTVHIPEASSSYSVVIRDFETNAVIPHHAGDPLDCRSQIRGYVTAYLQASQKVIITINEPAHASKGYYPVYIDYLPYTRDNMTQMDWLKTAMDRKYKGNYEAAISGYHANLHNIVSSTAKMALGIQIADGCISLATSAFKVEDGFAVFDPNRVATDLDIVGAMNTGQKAFVAATPDEQVFLIGTALSATVDAGLSLAQFGANPLAAYQTIIVDFAQAGVYLFGVFRLSAVEKGINAHFLVKYLFTEHINQGVAGKFSESYVRHMAGEWAEYTENQCGFFEDKAGCGLDNYDPDMVVELYNNIWTDLQTWIGVQKNSINYYEDVDGDGVVNTLDQDPNNPLIPIVSVDIPIAQIIPNATNVNINSTVVLDGSSSYHPGDLPFTYQWSLIPPMGSSASLSGSESSMTFTADMAGQYTVSLVLDDGISMSTPAREQIIATDDSQTFYDPDRWDKVNFNIASNNCGEVIQLGNVTLGIGEYWDDPRLWATTYSDGVRDHVYFLIGLNSPPTVDSDASGYCDQYGGVSKNKFNSDFLMDMYDGTLTNSGTVTCSKEWNKIINPGTKVYFAVGVSNNYAFEIRQVTMQTNVLYDKDGDGVSDEKDVFETDPLEWADSDEDGIGDNADKFDNDPAAYKDSDDDGYPDSWITGKSQSDSTTGLVLDHPLFVNDASEWADSDGDAVGNNADEFDNDAAASVDSDGDGFPDAWNTGKTENDSTTGLKLDKFSDDAAAAIDNDDDSCPDMWNPGKTESDSNTGLTLDYFSDDPTECGDLDLDGVGDNTDEFDDDNTEWKDTDGDGVGDNADAAPDDPFRSTNVVPLIQDVDPVTVNRNEKVEVVIIATDDDNDAITLTLIITPSFVSFSNKVLTAWPQDLTETGDYVIKIKANDDYGGASYKTIVITVMPSPDTDSDGIPDYIENATCTDSNDADTDDDGILDGFEDADHDGVFGIDDNETDPCNPDSDEDGLQDGTELGYTLDNIGPDTDLSVFRPDLDPDTMTNPTNADSNGDGILDGEHDVNHNGRVDDGESDPNGKHLKAMPFIPLLLLE